MSEFPQGWLKTSLGKLVVLNPRSLEEDELNAGFVPMANVSDVYGDDVLYETKMWGGIKKGYTHIRDEDVIVAKITPCFENGKAAIVSNLPNGFGAGSTEFYVLRVFTKFVDKRYIYAQIKSADFLQSGKMRMTGAVGHKRVPKDFVLDFSVGLPPLNEQIRIANKLDSLLAKVQDTQTRLEKIPGILKRFRQSILAAATSGELTKEWREGNRFTSPIETWPSTDQVENEFEIPASWKGISLGSVCERVSVGHVGKTSEFYTDESEGVPFLRSQNVRPGKISLKGLNHITHGFHDSLKKSQLQAGDLLVVRVGANRGDACVLPDMFDVVNCANIVFARPEHGLSAYLNVYFQAPQPRALLLGKTVGGAQGVINTKVVEATFLALPPIEEQIEIVRRVETLFALADKIEKQYQAAKQHTDRLTQSLLAKAFRGELVSQDPNDEPASELLKHIQVEREALEKTKSKKRARKKA